MFNRFKSCVANRLGLLVCLIVVLVVLVVWVSNAEAYNHAAPCRASLRGYSSDDDIHTVGLRLNATRFIGWQINIKANFVSWHGPDGSIYMRGTFGLPGGGWRTLVGHCWGGDYHGDHFHI